MVRFFDRQFRRTTLIAVFCAAVLMGIGLARFVSFSVAGVLACLLLLVIAALYKRLALLLVCLLIGLSIGGVQGSRYMEKLTQYEPYYGKKVTLVGRAADDGVYGRQKQLTYDLKHISQVNGEPVELVGKVGVSGFGENMVFRGDTVLITGKLKRGTGAHQGWMSFAKMSVIERETSLLEKVRREFGEGMMTALPEPLASFGLGLLLGQRSTLPKEVHQDLLMVGLVHIIAVSGYNLTIIMRACWKLLGDRSKYQTMVISLLLMGTFLLLTGGSASIVRASLVSGLSLLAWYYGRSFRPVSLILLAASITAIANPLYVWTDLGWYLSFLAFYGVLVLAPLVRYRFMPVRFRESLLLGIALESICA